MKLTKLSAAILFGLASTGSFAGALDRSGQSISSFLQPGNYFEAGISILDPDVSGKDSNGNPTGDMAGDYYFPSAALKIQATDKFSVGLIYDQPFGADAEYTGKNNFVSTPSDGVLPGTNLTSNLPVVTGAPNAQLPNGTPVITHPVTGAPLAIALGTPITGSTSVEVDTQNLSLIFGYQPTENFNFYAGGVYQSVKGNVKLRGSTYSLFNGYDADIPEDSAAGWLAGAAYQIPEIALKASITYRSEIDHKVNVRENIPLISPLGTLLVGSGAIPGSALAGLNSEGETKITTPQSVNLDLQSGIMANTVAFANIRWVDWSNFAIQPHKFGNLSKLAGGLLPALGKPDGFNLVDYSKDQWSVTTGVGRKFNEKWAGNVSVGWDSGAGNPVTTLGPTEGYWNAGVGLQYSPTPATFIAGGVKYFWLGDADAQTGAHSAAGKFEDNNALAYGLKLGYKF